MNHNNQVQFSKSWENYWKNSDAAKDEHSQMPCFGGQAEYLERSWQSVLEPLVPTLSSDSCAVDIAAGSGVVTHILSRLLKSQQQASQPQLICTDYSMSACQEAHRRNSQIQAICAKSESLPLPSESVNLIVSQFGIEYAGSAGFGEAFRLLKPHGKFVGICHIKNGIIDRECTTHLDASRSFYDSGIFSAAENVFQQAHRVIQGQAARSVFVEADIAFSHSVNQCKHIFAKFGKDVCAGYLFRIFAELGQMFGNIQKYELSDVLAYLNNNGHEVRAYIDRMASMTEAALSEEAINSWFKIIANKHEGFTLSYQYQALRPEVNADDDAQTDQPIAWLIEVEKLIAS